LALDMRHIIQLNASLKRLKGLWLSEIIVDGVSHRYSHGAGAGNLTALDETSIRIPSEQIVSVVGPSGCGKTTLLNLIAGFLRPTSGSVQVDGRVVDGPGADRAVVFQADAVFPWLTVADNLSYGPRMRGVPKSEWAPRVERFLDLVGLSEFSSAHPKELSGGMWKRVDLARAYVNDASVLLLDEPFGALDVFTKEAIQGALLAIAQEEPRTILFVTHDIEEAIFVGDRILVMTPRPGRVASDIPVPFPRPRTMELRAVPAFQLMRLQIAGLLSREESTEAGA
jgi:NitT/TauT family transport system ATP-binding protein